jgi:pyruvate dehydrogenase E2 component (dihydrolipoamide acetyltransferase)
MSKDVVMPALGMSQETGLLIEWLKADGEAITKGEPLMVVETDKATEEIEVPASGILANVAAGAGDDVPVGQVIAIILAPGEKAPAAAKSPPVAVAESVAPPRPAGAPAIESPSHPVSPQAARIAADQRVDLSQVEPRGDRIQKADVLAYLAGQQLQGRPAATDGRSLASPKARRLAAENKLDLAAISGSGPDGAVLADDVENAVASLVEAPPAGVAPPGVTLPAGAEVIPTSRKWQIMAQRLGEAWRTIPHFYLKRDVGAGRLADWLESARQRAAEKITYTDLLIKLAAAALRKHSRVNASWIDGQIIANPEVNVGLAVAVEDGLVVPVIRQADTLNLSQIAARRIELVSAAREGGLSLVDLQGGTFTVSNLGMFGVDEFSAIVNPPQAAILATGRIAERVVPVAGQPAVRSMMTLTLSCDHRVVDGARGAQFLEELAQWIEDPLALLD